MKKFYEMFDLFLSGQVEMYANPLVKFCVPCGAYIEFVGLGSEIAAIKFRNTLLDRDEILKIKRQDLTPQGDDRFFRSTATLAKLSLLEIELGKKLPFPKVYSINKDPAFTVQEFVDGVTLFDYITKQPQLSIEDKLRLYRKLASGLSLLHKNGIVHRDINPNNIIVDQRGEPWWIDFGLVKSCYDNALTITNTALGTLEYMAPEQMTDAASVDYRADIFSFGRVLHFMVTEGDESWDPDVIEERCGENTAELLVIIPQCMERDPDLRYQSIEELVADIDELFPQLGVKNVVMQVQEVEKPVFKDFRDLLLLYEGNVGKLRKMLSCTKEEMKYLMKAAQALVT